jgi:glyoxylase-like metal-dependent hydrolase (beta-lactamase superfamily II)
VRETPAVRSSEPTSVADGVTRLGTELVNWYVIEDGGRLTVVDAGVPAYRPQLDQAVAQLGRNVGDVEAVILTHAHGDHVGVAEMVRREAGARVFVHEADRELAMTAKAFGKNERSLLPYLRYPMAWRLLTHLMRGGGLKPRPIAEVTTFADGETLEVPGRPRAIHTPGHRDGHCAFFFESRGALFVGDALCTLNPLTGRRGPQLMPSAFNRSSQQCLESLARLDPIDAATLLPGHGEPWTDGTRTAVEQARAVGPT